jgi:hypothetical protein
MKYKSSKGSEASVLQKCLFHKEKFWCKWSEMDGRVLTCLCCNVFKSLTLRALLNHCFVIHRNEPNFQVACNVDGCPAVFKKYNSFYKHVSKHQAVYDKQAQAPQQDRAEDEVSNNNDQYQHHSNDINDSEHSDMDEDMDENHQAADQVLYLILSILLDALLIYIGFFVNNGMHFNVFIVCVAD